MHGWTSFSNGSSAPAAGHESMTLSLYKINLTRHCLQRKSSKAGARQQLSLHHPHQPQPGQQAALTCAQWDMTCTLVPAGRCSNMLGMRSGATLPLGFCPQKLVRKYRHSWGTCLQQWAVTGESRPLGSMALIGQSSTGTKPENACSKNGSGQHLVLQGLQQPLLLY